MLNNADGKFKPMIEEFWRNQQKDSKYLYVDPAEKALYEVLAAANRVDGVARELYQVARMVTMSLYEAACVQLITHSESPEHIARLVPRLKIRHSDTGELI